MGILKNISLCVLFYFKVTFKQYKSKHTWQIKCIHNIRLVNSLYLTKGINQVKLISLYNLYRGGFFLSEKNIVIKKIIWFSKNCSSQNGKQNLSQYSLALRWHFSLSFLVLLTWHTSCVPTVLPNLEGCDLLCPVRLFLPRSRSEV